MDMSSNPYNKIDPSSFLLRTAARVGNRVLLMVEQGEHNAFDMCVFRRYLFDTLSEELTKPFSLANEGNDYRLEVEAGWDEEVIRRNFRVVR